MGLELKGRAEVEFEMKRTMQAENIYNVWKPAARGPVSVQLDDLYHSLREWMRETRLTERNLVQARVYLTDAANQWPEVRAHGLCARLLSVGALSYVEQPMLDGCKVALLVWFNTGGVARRGGTPDCRVMEMGGVRYLWHSVRFAEAEVAGMSSEAQTMEAFRRHVSCLRREGMTLKDNCLRTWIYVRDVDRHYAGVVSGRNRVFEAEGLTAATHYIASTGIGGYSDNREAAVAMDFLSADGLREGAVRYLHAPDYLNPTHEYGVAFERATCVELPEGRTALVSGTASIDKHGQCLYRGDVGRQADRLFLNVEKLLEDVGMSLSHLKYALVYLRDVADCGEVEAYMRRRFPALPCLILEARVCRPEWLIEVEGVAVSR